MASNVGNFVIDVSVGTKLKIWGLICAQNAEAEGMRAENMQRELQGDAMAYTARDFSDVANEIRYLVAQLGGDGLDKPNDSATNALTDLH